MSSQTIKLPFGINTIRLVNDLTVITIYAIKLRCVNLDESLKETLINSGYGIRCRNGQKENVTLIEYMTTDFIHFDEARNKTMEVMALHKLRSLYIKYKENYNVDLFNLLISKSSLTSSS